MHCSGVSIVVDSEQVNVGWKNWRCILLELETNSIPGNNDLVKTIPYRCKVKMDEHFDIQSYEKQTCVIMVRAASLSLIVPEDKTVRNHWASLDLSPSLAKVNESNQ